MFIMFIKQYVDETMSACHMNDYHTRKLHIAFHFSSALSLTFLRKPFQHARASSDAESGRCVGRLAVTSFPQGP